MIFRFSKDKIVKGNSSFNKIFQQGKVFTTQFFVAYVLNNGPLQFGFAVQKGYRNKPERNRIKRITKEILRTHYKNYNLSHQMVILSKLQVLHTRYNLLEKDMDQLLLKIQNNKP